MDTLLIIVVFAGILTIAGFLAGRVQEGHQAIRFRLGKRVKNDKVFDEGFHFIIPIVENLKQFKIQTLSAELTNYQVQTGSYVNASVSIACEWQIDPDRIYAFSSGPNVIRAIEGTMKEVTAAFFRHLLFVEDMYNAKMIGKFSDTLYEAVTERVAGSRVSLQGASWSEIEVQPQSGKFSDLGVMVTGLNVLQVEFPNLVRDAQQRNLAGSIDSKTVRETGAASAEAVGKMVEAGGTGDIAQLQNERIISPQVKRTQVPDQQNILIQNPQGGVISRNGKDITGMNEDRLRIGQEKPPSDTHGGDDQIE